MFALLTLDKHIYLVFQNIIPKPKDVLSNGELILPAPHANIFA
jgi:hypothetical protein